MMRRVAREGIVFGVLLAVLALAMHGGELPDRIAAAAAAPGTILHALLYTTAAYVTIWPLRLLLKRLVGPSKR